MAKIHLQVLSPRPLNTKEEVKKLFSLWEKYLPYHLPEQYGTTEPIRIPFDLNKCISELHHDPLPSVFFIRQKPKLEAAFFYRGRNDTRPDHSTLAISLSSKDKEFDQQSVLSFIEELTVTFNADFACAHIVTKFDTERSLKNDSLSRHRPDRIFITTHKLRKGLPDLYWFTVLGRPYIQMFGRSKLLQAPVHAARQLTDGQISLQLTPDILDCVNRQEDVELARTKTRYHIDENAIHDPSLPDTHKYNVPEFVFE